MEKITLKNGEHMEYISKNGTKYHVFNINGIL